jgi:isoleucyl-tRNA synthetase
MKANLAEREPAILQRWEAEDLYGKRQALRADAEKYILHDGPPYANGSIHLGHAVNKTLKDIVCRVQFLNGYATPYVPGWDCHGLPIEINVEKKLGKPGVKVSAKQFREACRDYAAQQVDGQRADFKRLGVLGDWNNPYLTMNYGFEANTIRALKNIVEKGYLKQGFKPIYWCFNCQSSLAEAEVEYQDKTSPSIDVKFAVVDQAAFENVFAVAEVGRGPISVVIWTTTPWTLPANYGVALNPEFAYALVQAGEQRFVLAADLVEDCMQRYGVENYRILATTKGANFDRFELQHPFLARTSLIVLGDHVTLDAGTGAVHTAPAHGEEDFRVSKHYDLAVESPVGANGVFSEAIPELAGLFVFKANDKIIELLQQHGKLVHLNDLHHSYPHCWRHKTPVAYRATPQWFIAMDNLADATLNTLSSISWKPAWGQERMANMLRDRPDWCISRQRVWGVPIPIFTHKDTNQLHPDTVNLMEKVAEKVEQAGIEAWFEIDVRELLGSDAGDYVQCQDVLDVWFDSGCTHYAVLSARPELQFPANMYLEGSDQYRGWFQSSLLTSMAIHDVPPYKQVMTHGFTVDAHGRKMSKSLGNVIAPEKVLKQYGADILRLWIASTDFTGEMTVSDEILKRNADLYRRIRNTARFLLSNLADFVEREHRVSPNDMVAIDRWIVMYAAELQVEIIAAYQANDFHLAMQKIHHFCSVELGGFYLDIIKDRQYTCKTDGIARRSAQTAMQLILEALVRWIAPVLCFTADEIWQVMSGERVISVHLESWFTGLNIGYSEGFANDYWQTLLAIRAEVNKQIEAARKNGEIGSALAAEVMIAAPEVEYAVLEKIVNNELRFVFITSGASIVKSAEKKLQVVVKKSTNHKCERCWHHQESVNANAELPGICERCAVNIAGDGETRQFA